MIPVLTTERLTLRAPTMADFNAFAAFWASEDRTRFLGGPRDLGQAWKTFAADLGHWHLRGFGVWTVDEAGQPVGNVGPYNPADQQDLELVWTAYEGAEGRGIASEAARAARRWIAETLKPTRLVSYIDRDNAASIRLAERLGAVAEGSPAHDPLCVTYVHPVNGGAE